MNNLLDGFGPGVLARFGGIIDVRSPSEFAEDHIPGAISLPVLDDAERAEVGTIYKQESRFLARRIGAAHVSRNIARHLETALRDRPPSWRPLVYCWRGGMRSGAMSTILSQVGWHTTMVRGGYRTWRRHVIDRLHGPDPLLPHAVILDGNTGTAKTAILAALAQQGVQVLDLERLAAHRGSLFGHLPDRAQPPQKLFESRLAVAIEALDPARPVVIEAESSRIGALMVPPAVWRAMSAAPMFEISAPLAARARYLCRSYADIIGDEDRRHAVIDSLRPLIAKERIAQFHALSRSGAHAELAAALMLAHYDPAYERHRARQNRPRRLSLPLPDLEEADIAGAANSIARALETLPAA